MEWTEARSSVTHQVPDDHSDSDSDGDDDEHDDENDNYDENGDYSRRVCLQKAFLHAAMIVMVMHCIDDKHLDNGDGSGVPTVYMAKGMNILMLIKAIIVTNPIT